MCRRPYGLVAGVRHSMEQYRLNIAITPAVTLSLESHTSDALQAVPCHVFQVK